MSDCTGTPPARSWALPMIALSLALHAGGLAAAARVRSAPAPARARIDLEVVRREPRAPAPPPPAPPRSPPLPAFPRQLAARLPERPAPDPAPAVAPPPSLPAGPPAEPPRALPRVGLSLGSTVSSGAFAVAVGNTAHGRPAERAADPASVARYGGGVVPAARLSAQPRPLDTPAIPYPPEARRAGIEGQVVLVLRLDATGAVRDVRVIAAPSPDLARAAGEGALRFRFSPALADGEPVPTELRFTYTFLLE